MKVDQLIYVALALVVGAVLIGAVLIPIVTDVGEPSISYTDDDSTTAIGASATSLTWETGFDGGKFTAAADTSIVIGGYTVSADYASGATVYAIALTSAASTVLATYTGASIVLAYTEGLVWFNNESFEQATAVTGISGFTAGALGASYTATNGVATQMDSVYVSLFMIVGIVAIVGLVVAAARYFI